jgi:hypothetical protein
MSGENVTAIFSALPANVTNEQALAWIKRVRRVLSRWEELPADQTQAMTPEIVEQAIGELNHMEWLIHREMNASRQA